MSDFPNCVWVGPVFEPTGYADEGRGLLVALEALGVPVALRAKAALDPAFQDYLPAGVRDALDRQCARAIGSPYVMIQHYLADGFVPAPQAGYIVGRTMFESDSLPPSWVARCNAMDELWVPSEFNRETFRRAGVRVPMHLVPGGIDSSVYRPDVESLHVDGLRGTVFLSVFEWRMRKGWDVLLRAWAEAFSATDNVTLLLRTHAERIHATDNPTRAINDRIDGFLRDSCGRTRVDVAPIVILGDDLPVDAMPSLYRCADALVAPTRGEGWGRPFMEAMASGVPVIATRWGAHLEFMNDANSFLIESDGLVAADDPDAPVYAGQRWASPSVSDLVSKLRLVHADPELTRATGTRARRDMVELWPWSRAAEAMAERLREIATVVSRSTVSVVDEMTSNGVLPRLAACESLSIDVEVFGSTPPSAGVEPMLVAMADEFGEKLRVHGHAEHLLRPSYGLPSAKVWPRVERLSGVPYLTNDVTMTWLTRSDGTIPIAPLAGAWVVCTGDRVRRRVADSLVDALCEADAVWVPHHAAYEACVACGIAESRLWCIPFGTIADIVTPDAARFARPRDVSTLLLLPVLDESDIAPADLVLRVWQRLVTAESDVRLQLVVPSDATGTLDSWAESLQRRMRAGRLSPGMTAEVFVTACTDDLLPGLIRSADVVVAPGAIAMNVWQIALACGRPLIVPASVDATELLDGAGAWLVRNGANGMVSGLELGAALRDACDVQQRDVRAARARTRAESMPSWETIAGLISERIQSVRASRNARVMEHAS